MLSLIRKARLARAFSILAGEVTQTEQVFVIEALLLEEVGDAQLAHFARSGFLQEPDVRRLCDARWLGPVPELERLASLPEGTLGHAFALHMRSRGLRVDFYPTLRPTDELRWTIARARQTHDVLHVVTGYDTDPVGEVALQGFTLGQLRTAPISVVIISAGLLAILRQTPERIEEALELLTEGWVAGSAARCFLGFEFEAHWETPLEEVRRLLRIPATGGVPAACESMT